MSIQNDWKIENSILNPSSASVLADKIEVAVASGSRGELAEIADKIEGAYKHLYRQYPEIRNFLIKYEGALESHKALYSMGQLSFASRFVSQVLQRRECKLFSELMMTFSKYVEILSKGECSGVDLADKLHVAPETVSRNLKRLRDAGIAEFRREGTVLVNFLTPAAKSAVANMQKPAAKSATENKQNSENQKSVKHAINSLTKNLQPELQRHAILAVGAEV